MATKPCPTFVLVWQVYHMSLNHDTTSAVTDLPFRHQILNLVAKLLESEAQDFVSYPQAAGLRTVKTPLAT